MPSPSALLVLCLALPCLALSDEDFEVTRKPYEPGERLRFETSVELQLTATVALGFLIQKVNYELLEEETLELVIGAADDEDGPSRQVSYPLARRTSVAPLVGKRVKDRRVSGKSYVVRRDEDGLAVFNPDGAPTREKEAREVRRSCFAVGPNPALFALLPPGDLAIGVTLKAEGTAAKRLLGLGLEELAAEALQLTLRGPGEGSQVLFDASASISGEAELAGRRLTLSAELSGLLVADRNTGRMVSLELSGPLEVGSVAGSGGDRAAGTGTLTIKRQVGIDD